jgi:hypothetical protein
MKKLIIVVAGLALLASPAFAQTAKTKSGTSATTGQAQPRLFTGQGIVKGNDVYDCTGKYIGSDPDPNVRAQLLRSGSTKDACSGE